MPADWRYPGLAGRQEEKDPKRSHHRSGKRCSQLADIKTSADLGKQFVRQLEEFFVDYHKLSGEQYRVLGLKGRAEARKLVKSSRK